MSLEPALNWTVPPATLPRAVSVLVTEVPAN